MKIIKYKNYEEMSEASSKLMVETIQKNSHANLCLASGGSPELTYKKFVEKAREMDVSQIIITKLDEWCGIASDSPLACEHYLHELVLNPLHITNTQYISFLPSTNNVVNECQKVQFALQKHPIDLCVLGLGKNGHLGLNEPNVYLQPHAHQATLSTITKHHAMIEGSTLTMGMTIGMAEIMASKKIVLQVSGDGKTEIFQQFLSKKIDTQLPATFLWLHPNVEVHVRCDQFTF